MDTPGKLDGMVETKKQRTSTSWIFVKACDMPPDVRIPQPEEHTDANQNPAQGEKREHLHANAVRHHRQNPRDQRQAVFVAPENRRQTRITLRIRTAVLNIAITPPNQRQPLPGRRLSGLRSAHRWGAIFAAISIARMKILKCRCHTDNPKPRTRRGTRKKIPRHTG